MKNKEKLKEYFFQHPTARLRVRQIEREVGIPLPSAIRYAKELEKEGILRTTEIAGVKLYSADRGSRKFLLEKRFYNIMQLYDSGLIDHLVKESINAPIILFGSYAKGADIESSDIDIFVETHRELKDLHKFEKKLRREIQIFRHKKINDIKNKNLINSIMNGITLNSSVEVSV